jgi:hypothetical protein
MRSERRHGDRADHRGNKPQLHAPNGHYRGQLGHSRELCDELMYDLPGERYQSFIAEE